MVQLLGYLGSTLLLSPNPLPPKLCLFAPPSPAPKPWPNPPENHSQVHVFTWDQAWAHKIFIFRTEKNWNFRTFFRTPESQKRVFVISGAYNFGTFRAEAKITIRRHEVVYWLSSECKMIDLEWPLHAILMQKSGTTLLSLCPVLLTHK